MNQASSGASTTDDSRLITPETMPYSIPANLATPRQGNRHGLTTALITLGTTASAARILVLLIRGVLAATSVLPTLLSGTLFLLPGPVAPTLLLTALSASALFATLAALLLTTLMIVLVHEFLLCGIDVPT
jgi:hypothetical protein